MAIVAAAGAIGKIVVTYRTIKSTVEFVNDVKTDIKNVKNFLEDLKTSRMERVWKGGTNADSQEFQRKLAELDEDIQKALTILDNYSRVLDEVAECYKDTQQEVHRRASVVKRPTAR